MNDQDTSRDILVARGAAGEVADIFVTPLTQGVEIPAGTRLRTADGREFRVYKRTWWRTAIWAVRDRLRSARKRASGLALWSIVTPANAFCRWRWPTERRHTFWLNRWVPKFLQGTAATPSLYFFVAASHFQFTAIINDRLHIIVALGPDSTAPSNPPDTAIGLLERAEKPSARRPPRV